MHLSVADHSGEVVTSALTLCNGQYDDAKQKSLESRKHAWKFSIHPSLVGRSGAECIQVLFHTAVKHCLSCVSASASTFCHTR
jgi:hypothetical protein